MSRCLRARTSRCAASSSAKNALRCCSMVERAARNRFQSSFASLFGQARAVLLVLLPAGRTARRARRSCFHCVFAGSCAASASACSTMRVRSAIGLVEGGLRLGLLLLGELLRRAGERLEAARERVEVADGVGVGDALRGAWRRPWRHPPPGLRDARAARAADLAGEVGVLALEVGERLLGVASGYCPTSRSPSLVRTKTVPVSSTRPHGCCSESVTDSPCRGRMPPQRGGVDGIKPIAPPERRRPVVTRS